MYIHICLSLYLYLYLYLCARMYCWNGESACRTGGHRLIWRHRFVGRHLMTATRKGQRESVNPKYHTWSPFNMARGSMIQGSSRMNADLDRCFLTEIVELLGNSCICSPARYNGKISVCPHCFKMVRQELRLFGWDYLSKATCQIRPHVCCVLLVLPRFTIVCYAMCHI